MNNLLLLLQTTRDSFPDDSISFIDVRDCAAIHIAGYEKGEGRYMCVSKAYHSNDLIKMFKENYPKMKDIKPIDNPVKAT